MKTARVNGNERFFWEIKKEKGKRKKGTKRWERTLEVSEIELAIWLSGEVSV